MKTGSRQFKIKEGAVCFMCGAGARDFWQTDQIRHVLLYSYPERSYPGRPAAICDECKEGLQAITLPKPERIHLLSQTRRATIDDQRALLDWLLRKFRLVGVPKM